MRKLQVVMPMAGRGQRFIEANFELPKPLILVDGKPMFLRALDSIRGIESDLFLIIRKDADEKFALATKIELAHPEANIHILDVDTRGAAESILSLANRFDMNSPLLILDCDLFFESREFLELIDRSELLLEDGLLLTFNSNDPRYSYVKSDRGLATLVREKIVISEQALIGAYFWKQAGNFLKFAKKCLSDGISERQPEFYISNTFQKAIEAGRKFRVINGSFQSFGTPEELSRYTRDIQLKTPSLSVDLGGE